jgi:hypothetical protein
LTSFVTTDGADYVLDVLFGQSQVPLPSYWIALCNDVPEIGDDGSTIIEPDPTQGYVRVELVNEAANFALSGYGEMVNANDLVWPPLPDETDWGVLVAYGVLDTPNVATGRLLLTGLLSPPVQPDVGISVRVQAGLLAFAVASVTPSYQPT